MTPLQPSSRVLHKGGACRTAQRPSRLFDQVAQAARPLMVEHPRLGLVRLPGVLEHADAVRSTSLRYVFMPCLSNTCRDLILRRTELLAACHDILRIPARALWIEFSTRDLRTGEEVCPGEVQRAGMLVETDDGGRKGILRSFWEDPDYGPECSPASLAFDFDRCSASHRRAECTLAERLDELLGCTTPQFDPGWLAYYRVILTEPMAVHLALSEAIKTLQRDFLVLAALSLLLLARSELVFRSVELERLNASRKRAGRPALLDCVEVACSLLGDHCGTASAAGVRTAPRLHHVRGHLVRRRNRVFWRRPHMRGRPDGGPVRHSLTRLSL